MTKKATLICVFAFLITSTFAQIFDPVSWNFDKKITGENSADLIFHASIDTGWYLYGTELPSGGPRPTTFVFEVINNASLKGEIQPQSNVIYAFDPNFGLNVNWYTGEAIFIQSILFDDINQIQIEGFVEYMACNPTTCLPPTREYFSFGTKQTSTSIGGITASTLPFAFATVNNKIDSDTSRFWTPVINELQAFGEISATDTTLWWILLFGFLGGLLALLTPCVWPIVPMTVSFFLKRTESKSQGRRDALFYGVAIVLIYVVLGLLITLIFGASALNNLATSAIFNLFIFALLVIFAVSFFGAFEIALPSKWANKMDEKAGSTAGFLSILFMAFTLVLVSFSCTGPIIGILLVQVSTTSILAPLFGMLGFSIALAIPFSLLAFFPSLLKSIPKSGGWLNRVKVVLAFITLAVSLKFLSTADLVQGWRLLDREVFIVLWVAIFVLLGIYLLGKLRFAHDSETKHTSVSGLFGAIFAFAFALYLVPGLWGAPLKAVSSFLPPMSTQAFNLQNNSLRVDFDDFDEGMLYASRNSMPVLVYFSGHACGNCRKMETRILSDPQVQQKLDKFVIITLKVDERTALTEHVEVEDGGRTRHLRTIGDKWSFLQRHKFGANAQPFFVLLDSDGKPLNRSFAFDDSPQRFLDWLNLK